MLSFSNKSIFFGKTRGIEKGANLVSLLLGETPPNRTRR